MSVKLIENDDGSVTRQWKCRCGATVESYRGYDVECDRCGRDYNGYGQELAPASQWEESEDY